MLGLELHQFLIRVDRQFDHVCCGAAEGEDDQNVRGGDARMGDG